MDQIFFEMSGIALSLQMASRGFNPPSQTDRLIAVSIRRYGTFLTPRELRTLDLFEESGFDCSENNMRLYRDVKAIHQLHIVEIIEGQNQFLRSAKMKEAA